MNHAYSHCAAIYCGMQWELAYNEDIVYICIALFTHQASVRILTMYKIYHYTVQVARDCKCSNYTNGWMKKHHQRKLQRFIPPRVQMDYLC